MTQFLFKTQKHHHKTAFDHATYDDQRKFEPTENIFKSLFELITENRLEEKSQ